MSDTETAAPVMHEVRLKVTRYVTFNVEKAQDLFAAIYRAEANLWDGDAPDDEDMPSSEVTSVRFGDHEIELSYHYDWNAPLVRGLHQQVTVVRLDGKEVSQSHSFESAVRLAEAALDASQAGA